eukprot:TRINITY_DN7419_c0_g1_i2.p1 TRINITY_DN7419_c0_g1~~TRINITY_DN7419_c0_g1_i2.p1  ORF type:complete len:309 (+),score=54.12 TRINITY_DN7419_c0_g1_i2:63-989(+)
MLFCVCRRSTMRTSRMLQRGMPQLGWGISAAGPCRAAGGGSTCRGASQGVGVPVRLSPRMTQKATRGLLEHIDLIVYDMAGTTVQEGGLVYQVLQRSMTQNGLNVPDEAMEPWHGAKKEAVIEHFARASGVPEGELEEKIEKIGGLFINSIDKAYFDDASTISHIDVGLFGYFKQLKQAGLKVALDTGYPPNIQEGLVKRLGFDTVVDAYISAYEVPEGRPFPYMVHRLMERLNVCDVRRVAKVGDSVRDIEEGRNAGCGLVVGVLSGADGAEELLQAGADVIAECATDLPVPRMRARTAKMRLPDLS